MNNNCFVIQPFDKSKFDKRYSEIVKPTIESCGLIAYRVDEDISVSVPIESIEKGIRNARICLAEITTNNPNVWYELGFAFACGKNIIMICSDEREKTPYPFDIRHRYILSYKTQSIGDYEELKRNLKDKIMFLLNDGVIQERFDKEITDNEICILKTIVNNQISKDEITSRDRIFKNNNLNETNINIAIKRLIIKNIIEFVFNSENGETKGYYRLTSIGDEWIIKNELLII